MAVAAVHQPKNKAFMGRYQVRIVRDPLAVSWMCWLTESMALGDLIWPYSAARFGQCFATAARFYDLDGYRLSPASLRAGGATFQLECGVPVASIRFHGAWASERSLCCYLQEAEAAGVLLSIGPCQARRLQFYLAKLSGCLAPPCLGSQWALPGLIPQGHRSS